ncbi:hypothetical protein [Methylobacterium haplocladii]|nr:hypothetical protein [Methylobacterium haplocladii]GJD84111.1 hypothetical protein HPGCJGGD_1986 [Methylobacterium haplocladii]
MSLPSRLCAVALLAAALGGCNAIGGALGGGGGVMPESEVGPPPSMRGSIKTAPQRTAAVDEDGNAIPAAPTRQLALPKTVKGDTRSADAGPRRINREDLEGADTGGRRGSGGSMGPAMTPGGGVGLGGKF